MLVDVPEGHLTSAPLGVRLSQEPVVHVASPTPRSNIAGR